MLWRRVMVLPNRRCVRLFARVHHQRAPVSALPAASARSQGLFITAHNARSKQPAPSENSHEQRTT